MLQGRKRSRPEPDKPAEPIERIAAVSVFKLEQLERAAQVAEHVRLTAKEVEQAEFELCLWKKNVRMAQEQIRTLKDQIVDLLNDGPKTENPQQTPGV
ncbi:MAG: hypothetical protein KF752_17850 [Pirellulaceae bacterium]|nr:hypothetical protein [Pirellulaceae bacterium]